MRNHEVPESLIVPSALSAAVQAMAQEEHRPPEEVLREAVENYLHRKRWEKIFAYGETRAHDLGISEEDIPRLIAEYRQENR